MHVLPQQVVEEVLHVFFLSLLLFRCIRGQRWRLHICVLYGGGSQLGLLCACLGGTHRVYVRESQHPGEQSDHVASLFVRGTESSDLV